MKFGVMLFLSMLVAYFLGILGNPIRTFHDDFKNTYAFTKDGVKITLGYSKLKITSKPSKGRRTISNSF